MEMEWPVSSNVDKIRTISFVKINVKLTNDAKHTIFKVKTAKVTISKL